MFEATTMAQRAITEALGFCALGDLLSFRFESGDPGGSVQFIRFVGTARLFGLATRSVRGRVIVVNNGEIRRWVPYRAHLEADRVNRFTIDFAHWFDELGRLALGLTAGYCAPDAWPNVPDMGRRLELIRRL